MTIQKLILPIDDAKITASINTGTYYETFGFNHFGTDFISESKTRKLLASGEGTVLDTGFDSNCGNVIVIKYKNAYNHVSKAFVDIVFRYFHLERTAVKKGDIVRVREPIGEYGATGKHGGTGKHLHIEADLDTVNHIYTPTVSSSDYLKGRLQGAYDYYGNENTVRNCMEFLHRGSGQSLTTAGNSFIRVEDLSPCPLGESVSQSASELALENHRLRETISKIEEIILAY